MATRLYLHDAVNALPGVFPSAEQSTVMLPTFLAPTANTLRTMNTTVGSAMATRSLTSSATLVAQTCFCAMFCSDTLDSAQVIVPQILTLNIANRESSASMNIGADMRINAYLWRPSSGTVVGYLVDGLAMAGDVEPGAALSIRTNIASITSTATLSAAAGDVLICEVWNLFTQSVATALQASLYWDGTTTTTTNNTVVTNHASYFDLGTSTLTFGSVSLPTVSGAFSNTLESVLLSANPLPDWDSVSDNWDAWTPTWNDLYGPATGTVADPAITGAFANTLGPLTLSGAAAVPVQATYSNTLGTLTLTGAGTSPRNGSFSNTLGTLTLTGVGTSPRNASFSNTLGTLTLAGAGSIPLAGTLNATLADAALNGAGTVSSAAAGGSFNNTLDGITLAATGALPIAGTYSNTLAPATLTGAATSPRNGSFSNTLAPVSLQGTVAIPVNGAYSNTLGAATLNGAGVVLAPGSAVGTFNRTLDAVALSAAGQVVAPVPVTPETNQGAGSGGARASQRKKFVVPSDTPRRSTVDDLFDQKGDPAVEPEPALKLVPVEANSMAKQLALAPYPAPVAPKATKVVNLPTGVPDEDEYSDLDMIMLALLA